MGYPSLTWPFSAICKLACGYLSLNVLIKTAGDGQPFQQSGPRQNGWGKLDK